GRAALVLFDRDLHEVSRIDAPKLASDLTQRSDDGVLLVTGKGAAGAAAYAIDGDKLVRRAALDVALGPPTELVPRPSALAAVAASPRCTYAADHDGGALVASCKRDNGQVWALSTVAPGLHAAKLTRRHLVVAALEGHTVDAREIDEGAPASASASIDGPIWAIDAVEDDAGTLFVAASGPEDAKLDRTGGSFANVDSFVYVFRLAARGTDLQRVLSVNVSEHGVVVPKALSIALTQRGLAIDVTSGGTATMLHIDVGSRTGALPEPMVEAREAVPGISAMVRTEDGFVGVDPLLDALVRIGPKSVDVVPVEPDRADPETDLSHLGEALVFTSLMAPWQSSEGPLSRFTCETCHFEGGVDGRTHATGRGTTTATTKPLFGLFNDAPHFTRALDEDSAETVYAEFRVAGAKSAGPTWFSLADTKAAWLAHAPWAKRVDGSPEGLRRGLLHYLRAAVPPPNPRVVEHGPRFTELEAQGAALFAAKCESCHAARLVTKDPATRIDPSEWEALVLSAGSPIVWARDGWEKTGVEPYVHPDGARPSSLRRVSTRSPHFTNGSARTIAEVLERARWSGDRFFHDQSPKEANALSRDDQSALAAFLLLL
ncbi:MAG TPA: hypothetical protein VL400_22675, partial [Polyangiaceae bacterium]|nr:hypothetical protein [Polyangiaceae bacterium]